MFKKLFLCLDGFFFFFFLPSEKAAVWILFLISNHILFFLCGCGHASQFFFFFPPTFGKSFPPSDESWREPRSTFFLSLTRAFLFKGTETVFFFRATRNPSFFFSKIMHAVVEVSTYAEEISSPLPFFRTVEVLSFFFLEMERGVPFPPCGQIRLALFWLCVVSEQGPSLFSDHQDPTPPADSPFFAEAEGAVAFYA